MIIGGIRSDSFNSTKFVASPPYMQDDLTWCVRRANEIPRWMNVYYIPKDFATYAAGFSLHIMTILLAYLLSTYEENSADLIFYAVSSVAILTQFNQSYTPRKPMNRIIFMLCVISTFWLTQIFNAYYFRYIRTTLYEIQICTLDDIRDNQFSFAGDSDVYNHLITGNAVRHFFSVLHLAIDDN